MAGLLVAVRPPPVATLMFFGGPGDPPYATGIVEIIDGVVLVADHDLPSQPALSGPSHAKAQLMDRFSSVPKGMTRSSARTVRGAVGS